MKKLNQNLIFIIIVLILFSAFLLYQNQKYKEVQKKDSALTDTQFYSIYKAFYEAYNSYLIGDNGMKLNKEHVLKNRSLQEIKLKDIVNDGILIFRFSANDCDMCFNSVARSLVETLNNQQLQRVCIVFDGYDDRAFSIKSDHLELPITMYKIDTALGLQTENKNLPFLFFLSRNMIAEKIFLPFKEIPQTTLAYLSHVKSLLELNPEK